MANNETITCADLATLRALVMRMIARNYWFNVIPERLTLECAWQATNGKAFKRFTREQTGADTYRMTLISERN